MKKALLILLIAAAIGGSGFAYYRYRETGPKVSVTTAAVTRGDVVDTVGATGTLQAVKTVQVGTQVSGTILSLYADFNSLVRKGQVLARLDPSLFETQIEQAKANLIRSQADLERLRVSLDDARQKLARARELSSRKLIPQSELDTAEVNVRAAEAQIRSSEAQVTQAQASLNQNQVNLDHTVIEAPIDGLVISRSVDVGQTVAASMQAPTLYVLAADLTKMQVVANLDESDVGRIRPGQRVTFRVDAYPNDQFVGAVSQVRLEPKVQQNVVTYATVIDVPNNELKLKPGMTANVNVEIARSANVLKIPNSALRFRPTNEMYAALGQTPPEQGRGGRGTPDGAAPSAHAEGEGPGKSATADARGRSGAGMSPEERDRTLQWMRGRGQDPSAPGAGRGRGQDPATPGAGRGRGQDPSAPGAGRGRGPAPTMEASATKAGATTIDALFGPLPKTESTGRVWLHVDKQLKPVRVRIGISDGQTTELIEGEIEQGAELVTNVSTGNDTRPSAAGGFPFLGPQQGRGGFGPPGGGFGGPGGGGGGNRGGAGGGGNRGGGR